MSTDNGRAVKPPEQRLYLTADLELGDEKLPLQIGAQVDGTVELTVGYDDEHFHATLNQ